MQIDAIFCGDLHLRESAPRCRKDDYLQAQLYKLDWLAKLQRKYQCPIFCSGDLLHNWKISTKFVYTLMKCLPQGLFMCLGNHDLPTHSYDRVYESGVAPLAEGGYLWCDKLNIDKSDNECATPFKFAMCSYNCQPSEGELLVIHEFVYKGRLPWPGCKSLNDKQFLEKYSNFRTILSGDNHQSFVTKQGDHLLVNPGSFMRMTIDQRDFQPSVYLWNKQDNIVERMFIPIEKDVFIDDNVVVEPDETPESLRMFVDSLAADNIRVSFRENIYNYIQSNNVDKGVEDYLLKWLEVS